MTDDFVETVTVTHLYNNGLKLQKLKPI